MSLVSFTPVVDNTTATAAGVNTPLSTIYNDYNGNITDANIASNAAIAGSKVSLASGVIPYKFSVYRAATMTSSASLTLIQFDTKTFDTGNNFSTTTSLFTAPIAGFYHFEARCGNTVASGAAIYCALYVNGSITNGAVGSGANTAPAGTQSNVSALFQLGAGDTVSVYFIGGGGSAVSVGQPNVYFHGFFVSA